MDPGLHIETIAIGDEILCGKISDTNSTHVATRLMAYGCRLAATTVIPDDIEETKKTVKEVAERSDLVICFGGLGPTSDDKTAEAISKMIGKGLEPLPEGLERITRFYKEKNRTLTEGAKKQALYPTGTTPYPNRVGLATSFCWAYGKCKIFFLPGVPREMYELFERVVLPEAQRLFPAVKPMKYHLWRCLGIWESELQNLLDPIEKDLPSAAAVGYRTIFPENHISLYWPGVLGDSGFEETVEKIRAALCKWTYSEVDKNLEELVLDALSKKGLTLALAESCTGGNVAARITQVPNSSKHFWGSYVVYQAKAKREMLGVILDNEVDAVSRETSLKLAEALKKKSGADCVAAITGYLGPTGGTDKDPIGTLYLCSILGNKVSELRLQLHERERPRMQWAASTYLLNLILKQLNG